MDGLTALFAGLLATLRDLVATDVCPGGWPWAVSALGVGVGLLPAGGAVLVALLRRRIGSRYDVGPAIVLVALGLISAGLLPLLAFTATGQVFSVVAAGGDPGLSAGDRDDLASASCVVGPQAEYLGGYPVGSAFDPDAPLRFGLALVLLAGLPLVAAMCVAAQARLALRRGPRWPGTAFWLPLLAVAVLTPGTPAGSSGQLWIGVTAGAFLGIVVVLMVGVPSREVVRRSLAGRPRPERRPVSTATPTATPRLPTADRPVGPATRTAPLDGGPSTRPPTRRATAPKPATPPPTLLGGPPLAAATGIGGAPRFRLIRRLGSGGFGRVWLAHDARLGHPVALKAAHAPDSETEQRIQREARTLAAVRHPHCVRILDLLPAASDPGLSELDGLVIVMEYVEGRSLGELVRSRGPLDDIAAARIWVSVAGALDAAHARGVMHRDVKPGNVVVDPHGLAHLIDFGIARTTGDATMTIAGFVLGTPDFLAPEVASGARATRASDTWQLGATISYALTGHPPRGGHLDAVSGLRAAACGARLTHLPQRSAHLALLRAVMDNDPARRPSLPVAHRALEDWLHRNATRPDGPVTAGASGR